MPAYIIANVDITDPAGYEAYRPLVFKSVTDNGGKFKVRGGPVEVLEGKWQPKRLIVLEFESMQAARDWYNSDSYAPAKAIRQRTAVTDVVLVEGL